MRAIRQLMLGVLVTTAMALPPELYADNGRRVVFARGKDTATYSGRLPRRTGDYYYYLVRAKKGQTLTVQLDSVAPGARLAVFETKLLGPEEDALLSPGDGKQEWSGKLPVTSDYSIQVYDMPDAGARPSAAQYIITITVR